MPCHQEKPEPAGTFLTCNLNDDNAPLGCGIDDLLRAWNIFGCEVGDIYGLRLTSVKRSGGKTRPEEIQLKFNFVKLAATCVETPQASRESDSESRTPR